MNGTVRSLNEHKYKKHGNELINLHQDHTYYKSSKKKWTKEEYTKAYMKMLTTYVNK